MGEWSLGSGGGVVIPENWITGLIGDGGIATPPTDNTTELNSQIAVMRLLGYGEAYVPPSPLGGYYGVADVPIGGGAGAFGLVGAGPGNNSGGGPPYNTTAFGPSAAVVNAPLLLEANGYLSNLTVVGINPQGGVGGQDIAGAQGAVYFPTGLQPRLTDVLLLGGVTACAAANVATNSGVGGIRMDRVSFNNALFASMNSITATVTLESGSPGNAISFTPGVIGVTGGGSTYAPTINDIGVGSIVTVKAGGSSVLVAGTYVTANNGSTITITAPGGQTNTVVNTDTFLFTWVPQNPNVATIAAVATTGIVRGATMLEGGHDSILTMLTPINGPFVVTGPDCLISDSNFSQAGGNTFTPVAAFVNHNAQGTTITNCEIGTGTDYYVNGQMQRTAISGVVSIHNMRFVHKYAGYLAKVKTLGGGSNTQWTMQSNGDLPGISTAGAGAACYDTSGTNHITGGTPTVASIVGNVVTVNLNGATVAAGLAGATVAFLPAAGQVGNLGPTCLYDQGTGATTHAGWQVTGCTSPNQGGGGGTSTVQPWKYFIDPSQSGSVNMHQINGLMFDSSPGLTAQTLAALINGGMIGQCTDVIVMNGSTPVILPNIGVTPASSVITYTYSGSTQTYTVPAGVSAVDVDMQAGGGGSGGSGGGGSGTCGGSTAGGGAGGYARAHLTSLSVGDTIAFSTGAGGVGGGANGGGAAGSAGTAGGAGGPGTQGGSVTMVVTSSTAKMNGLAISSYPAAQFSGGALTLVVPGGGPSVGGLAASATAAGGSGGDYAKNTQHGGALATPGIGGQSGAAGATGVGGTPGGVGFGLGACGGGGGAGGNNTGSNAFGGAGTAGTLWAQGTSGSAGQSSAQAGASAGAGQWGCGAGGAGGTANGTTSGQAGGQGGPSCIILTVVG